jgi:hypothetical protein
MTKVRAKYRGAELGDLPVRFIGAPHVKERLQRAFTRRQRAGETIDADARICGLCANSHAYDTARCREQTVEEWLDEDERRVKLLAEHLRTNPETITGDTKIELAGWKTPAAPERSIKVGSWLYCVCKRFPRRLEALEKSPNDDVKKATAEVLRLTFEFRDDRRVLLLAEHLRTNPETITALTEIELAGWKTPASPVRSIKVGSWLHLVCTRFPRRLEALEKSRFDDVKKATDAVCTHVKASLIPYRH